MIKKCAKQLIWRLLLLSSCFAFFATSQIARPQSRQDHLTLVVTSTKSVYGKGEPIELHFTLQNAGEHQQIVARRLSLGMRIKLDILNPQNKPAKWCGRISDELFVLAGNYKTLSPGESIQQKLIISCEGMKDPKRGGYVFDLPGKYMIKAAYRLPMPQKEYEKAFPNANVIRGPVWAEPITIELQ